MIRDIADTFMKEFTSTKWLYVDLLKYRTIQTIYERLTSQAIFQLICFSFNQLRNQFSNPISDVLIKHPFSIQTMKIKQKHKTIKFKLQISLKIINKQATHIKKHVMSQKNVCKLKERLFAYKTARVVNNFNITCHLMKMQNMLQYLNNDST